MTQALMFLVLGSSMLLLLNSIFSNSLTLVLMTVSSEFSKFLL